MPAGGNEQLKYAEGGRLQAANLTPTTTIVQHILLASIEKPIPPDIRRDSTELQTFLCK